MSYKEMKKIASRGGFTFRKSNIHPYEYMLVNNRTHTKYHYADLDEARPDIEEIIEGGTPFA